MAPELRPTIASHPTDLSMPLIPGHAYLTLTMETESGPVAVDPIVLRRLGMSPEVAFDRALDWLRRHASASELQPVDTVPGMHFIQPGLGQTASRLATLPDAFASAPLGGILAAVPSGNQLLCVPIESAEAVQAMRVLAGATSAAFDHATHPVSDQMFWYDGHAWHVIRVERGGEDITVLPPPSFFTRMRQVASMDLVRVAGEA